MVIENITQYLLYNTLIIALVLVTNKNVHSIFDAKYYLGIYFNY